MNSQIKQIFNNIMKGKDLDSSIPVFFNRLTSTYLSYAQTALALNLEDILQQETTEEDFKEALEKMISCIQEYILNDQYNNLEDAVEKVNVLRESLEKRMEVILYYADVMSLYEYVVNRLEYRFKDPEFDLLTDEDFARKILQFIFEEEDNVVVNSRMKEAIAQLPIRLTKSKFFELLSNSLDAYKGADLSTFDSYLYMLRSGASLELPKHVKDFYPEYQKEVRWFKKVDFANMTEDVYKKAISRIQKMGSSIEEKTTYLYNYQLVVNELYACLLCLQYHGMDDSDFKKYDENAHNTLKALIDMYCKEEVDENRLTSLYAPMEGAQEELLEELNYYEAALEKINLTDNEIVNSLMLRPVLNALSATSKLLSNSMYAKLENVIAETVLTDEIFAERKEKLLAEYEELFKMSNPRFTKAVMASTLGRMPVFFGSHKEVMDYVVNAISNCTDLAEKAACNEIMAEIMGE